MDKIAMNDEIATSYKDLISKIEINDSTFKKPISKDNYRINYVIASYPGVTQSRNGDAYSEICLDFQLRILRGLIGNDSLINTITLIVVKCKPGMKEYESYYHLDEWKDWFPTCQFIILNYVGENKHHSYDQWLMGMLKVSNATHHIFLEDDHCISPDCRNFDRSLLEIYQEKFPNNIGYLCVLTLDHSNSPHEHHAAVPHGMISTQTLNYLENSQHLDLLKTLYQYRTFSQLAFCSVFSEHGVQIKDYTDKYSVFFWNSPTRSIIDCTKDRSKKLPHCVIPVQALGKPILYKIYGYA